MRAFKKKRVWILAAVFLILAGLCAAASFFLAKNGVITLNHPSLRKYPVRGVDVSAYQGEIDWEILASQGISFAYIKATEGSGFVDRCFAFNYEQAQKTGLRVGAYHFFSYDSEGKTQADNFIANVEKCENMLPPVIDLEFYGDKCQNPPSAETVREQLDVMLRELEAYYGMKPVIYATRKTYSLYLADAYEEYDIWIRNIYMTPVLSDKRKWTFWQYTNRQRLEGYSGTEEFIDMNVFNGTAEEFQTYGKE